MLPHFLCSLFLCPVSHGLSCPHPQDTPTPKALLQAASPAPHLLEARGTEATGPGQTDTQISPGRAAVLESEMRKRARRGVPLCPGIVPRPHALASPFTPPQRLPTGPPSWVALRPGSAPFRPSKGDKQNFSFHSGSYNPQFWGQLERNGPGTRCRKESQKSLGVGAQLFPQSCTPGTWFVPSRAAQGSPGRVAWPCSAGWHSGTPGHVQLMNFCAAWLSILCRLERGAPQTDG